MNISLKTEKVPKEFYNKRSKVTTIYKYVYDDKTNNHRPISVLPAIHKLLERIAYYQPYTSVKTIPYSALGNLDFNLVILKPQLSHMFQTTFYNIHWKANRDNRPEGCMDKCTEGRR